VANSRQEEIVAANHGEEAARNLSAKHAREKLADISTAESRVDKPVPGADMDELRNKLAGSDASGAGIPPSGDNGTQHRQEPETPRTRREELMKLAANTEPHERTYYGDQSPRGIAQTYDYDAHSTAAMERQMQATGLAYDMVQDPAVAKQVLAHRKVEGYDREVVEMASHGYAELKKSLASTDAGDAEEHFRDSQLRISRTNWGVGDVETTSARETLWKMRHGIAKRLGRRKG
jgi:hypothetical protein